MELSFHFLSEDLASWRPSQEPSGSRRKSPTELWGGPDVPASCQPESGWLSEEGEPVPPRPPETALSARDGSRSSASPALIPTCKAGGLEEQADTFSERPGVLLQAEMSFTSWCFKKWQVQVEGTKKSVFLTFLLQMCLQKLEAAPRLFQLVFLPRVPTGPQAGTWWVCPSDGQQVSCITFLTHRPGQETPNACRPPRGGPFQVAQPSPFAEAQTPRNCFVLERIG